MSSPADILVEIACRRRERIGDAAQGLPPSAEPAAAPLVDAGNRFLEALSRPGRSVIAEVKLGSPRLGDLRDTLDPERQARIYARAGAAAISVVVEEDFFFGSYELLARCARASGLPTLAKDFVVDPVQLEWAAAAGADAVLLIAALCRDEELAAMASVARQLGLVPLVEIHDAEDLHRLGRSPWEVVGVNNRDLRTFEVDLRHSAEMARRLPAAVLKVSESGLSDPEQLEMLAGAGFDAFLVGESLLLSEDPGRELVRLIGTPHDD